MIGDDTDGHKAKEAEKKPEQAGAAAPAPQPQAPAQADADKKALEERLMRLQAEFENYKKRVAKENAMLRESAGADVLLKLLPVVDDFDIAVAHMDRAPHKEFRQGMELIYAKLKDILKREGLEELKSLGESFDPYKHDALRQGEGEEGKVVEVIQKGYTLRGKVLRHAKVAVGKGKSEQR